MSDAGLDKVSEEIIAIKKLLILQLLDRGFSQRQLALALGIGQATVSRMFPTGVLKKRGRAISDEAS